jgi:hypothetical protein
MPCLPHPCYCRSGRRTKVAAPTACTPFLASGRCSTIFYSAGRCQWRHRAGCRGGLAGCAAAIAGTAGTAQASRPGDHLDSLAAPASTWHRGGVGQRLGPELRAQAAAPACSRSGSAAGSTGSSSASSTAGGTAGSTAAAHPDGSRPQTPSCICDAGAACGVLERLFLSQSTDAGRSQRSRVPPDPPRSARVGTAAGGRWVAPPPPAATNSVVWLGQQTALHVKQFMHIPVIAKTDSCTTMAGWGCPHHADVSVEAIDAVPNKQPRFSALARFSF